MSEDRPELRRVTGSTRLQPRGYTNEAEHQLDRGNRDTYSM
jgi:hypothetical protein